MARLIATNFTDDSCGWPRSNRSPILLPRRNAINIDAHEVLSVEGIAESYGSKRETRVASNGNFNKFNMLLQSPY